jgi:hypothetical protein
MPLMSLAASFSPATRDPSCFSSRLVAREHRACLVRSLGARFPALRTAWQAARRSPRGIRLPLLEAEATPESEAGGWLDRVGPVRVSWSFLRCWGSTEISLTRQAKRPICAYEELAQVGKNCAPSRSARPACRVGVPSTTPFQRNLTRTGAARHTCGALGGVAAQTTKGDPIWHIC